jgi:hypothetical protein
MAKESFEFMNVVGAFSAAASVLAIDGVYLQTPWANTENQRVLRLIVSFVFG